MFEDIHRNLLILSTLKQILVVHYNQSSRFQGNAIIAEQYLEQLQSGSLYIRLNLTEIIYFFHSGLNCWKKNKNCFYKYHQRRELKWIHGFPPLTQDFNHFYVHSTWKALILCGSFHSLRSSTCYLLDAHAQLLLNTNGESTQTFRGHSSPEQLLPLR